MKVTGTECLADYLGMVKNALLRTPETFFWERQHEVGEAIREKVRVLEYLVRDFEDKTSYLGIARGIEVLSFDGDIIGRVFPHISSYEDVGLKKSFHLFKEVNEDYRGQGYGYVLMKEYIDAGYPLPPYESTIQTSTMSLLLQFGYEIIGFYENEGYKECQSGDLLEINHQIEKNKESPHNDTYRGRLYILKYKKS